MPDSTRACLLLCSFVVACGGFLPFSGDDDDDAPPPPPPPPSSADAADDGAADASAASDANDEAAVGYDGGFPCVPSKKCAEDEFECCSGQGGTGCTMKCEITCCL